jgi:hypothetical protein
MNDALRSATQAFNQADPAHTVFQRGTYSPFSNGYPAWSFMTNPAVAPDTLYFAGNTLVIRHPDQTEGDYGVSFNPADETPIVGEVTQDLIQDNAIHAPTGSTLTDFNIALNNGFASGGIDANELAGIERIFGALSPSDKALAVQSTTSHSYKLAGMLLTQCSPPVTFTANVVEQLVEQAPRNLWDDDAYANAIRYTYNNLMTPDEQARLKTIANDQTTYILGF